MKLRFPPTCCHRYEAAQVCLDLLKRACRARQHSSGIPVSKSADSVPGPESSRYLPQANHHIGHFQVIRELGSGGYGVVFLAFDTLLRRQVALKVPRPEVLVTAELLRRFMREAQMAGSLAHPNLVTVYEVGEDGPFCYIASAYCDGPTLAEWLHNQAESVPIRHAAELVAALADGVENAHSRGVLHRDIKPSNVMLEPRTNGSQIDGPSSSRLAFIPKLTDFGLATLSEGQERNTQRTLLGTPSYMAPEQAAGRLDEDRRPTDVYALGDDSV